jgi:hypothetical protein
MRLLVDAWFTSMRTSSWAEPRFDANRQPSDPWQDLGRPWSSMIMGGLVLDDFFALPSPTLDEQTEPGARWLALWSARGASPRRATALTRADGNAAQKADAVGTGEPEPIREPIRSGPTDK